VVFRYDEFFPIRIEYELQLALRMRTKGAFYSLGLTLKGQLLVHANVAVYAGGSLALESTPSFQNPFFNSTYPTTYIIGQ
jgi:hypothetical protein